MRIGIISGSARQQSETGRICRLLATRLVSEFNVETDIFDLAKIHLPLWDEDRFEDGNPFAHKWNDISRRLTACEGFVIASPEWAGMAAPHLKNFLLYCDRGELAHKPALLAAVSAGAGGAYPIAELRMSGYKNSYVWWLPEHLLFRQVGQLFKAEDELSKMLQKRIAHCLKLLVTSAEALRPVRAKCQDLENYPFGM